MLCYLIRTKCEDSKRWIILKQFTKTYVENVAQNKTLVTPCIENNDFVRAERFGTCGTVLTVEGGAVLGETLRIFPIWPPVGTNVNADMERNL